MSYGHQIKPPAKRLPSRIGIDNRPLTERQSQVLTFIQNFCDLKGYSPSINEICSATGLSSTATVHHHLNLLQEKGKIMWRPGRPRSIVICDRAYNMEYLLQDWLAWGDGKAPSDLVEQTRNVLAARQRAAVGL